MSRLLTYRFPFSESRSDIRHVGVEFRKESCASLQRTVSPKIESGQWIPPKHLLINTDYMHPAVAKTAVFKIVTDCLASKISKSLFLTSFVTRQVPNFVFTNIGNYFLKILSTCTGYMSSYEHTLSKNVKIVCTRYVRISQRSYSSRLNP